MPSAAAPAPEAEDGVALAPEAAALLEVLDAFAAVGVASAPPPAFGTAVSLGLAPVDLAPVALAPAAPEVGFRDAALPFAGGSGFSPDDVLFPLPLGAIHNISLYSNLVAFLHFELTVDNSSLRYTVQPKKVSFTRLSRSTRSRLFLSTKLKTEKAQNGWDRIHLLSPWVPQPSSCLPFQ